MYWIMLDNGNNNKLNTQWINDESQLNKWNQCKEYVYIYIPIACQYLEIRKFIQKLVWMLSNFEI